MNDLFVCHLMHVCRMYALSAGAGSEDSDFPHEDTPCQPPSKGEALVHIPMESCRRPSPSCLPAEFDQASEWGHICISFMMNEFGIFLCIKEPFVL